MLPEYEREKKQPVNSAEYFHQLVSKSIRVAFFFLPTSAVRSTIISTVVLYTDWTKTQMLVKFNSYCEPLAACLPHNVEDTKTVSKDEMRSS